MSANNDDPELSHYRYFLLGRRLVRIGHNQDGNPYFSEFANGETKQMEINNNYMMKIMFGDPDDLREMDEPEFAELCLQKGVKSR
ncbi:MAG: hypothetical protein JKY71_10860 [Alphaproteobacteria bacterium]|nr:hypothetical protein [Alphaproteobacteria bacterium]